MARDERYIMIACIILQLEDALVLRLIVEATFMSKSKSTSYVTP